MPQLEVTYERKLNYSSWHRSPNLPDYCHAYNIDFVEVRNGEPKAFFEIAETKYNLDELKKNYILKFKSGHLRILRFLSNYTKLPSFIVFHNEDLRRFKVFETETLRYKLMNNNEYKEWIIQSDFK